MAEMQALAADVRSKRELLSKVVQAMNQMPCNGNDSQEENMISASLGPQQHRQPGNFIPVATQGNNGPSGNDAPWTHQMNALMSYANISAPDLRARCVPETVVQFVERNRDLLQHTQSLCDLVQRELPLLGDPESMVLIQALPRPTQEQAREAIQFIQQVKNEFIVKNLPIMKQHQVPENQRGEYNRILEQAYRCAQEVEPKLLTYFYVLKDADMVRKLIAIIYTTREQRVLIANGTQKFILPLSTLSTLISQVQQDNAQFATAVRSYVSRPSSAPSVSGHSGPTRSAQQETVTDAPSASVRTASALVTADDYLAELLGTISL